MKKEKKTVRVSFRTEQSTAFKAMKKLKAPTVGKAAARALKKAAEN